MRLKYVCMIVGAVVLVLVALIILDALVLHLVINKTQTEPHAEPERTLIIESTALGSTGSRGRHSSMKLRRDLNLDTDCTSGVGLSEQQVAVMVDQIDRISDEEVARTCKYCPAIQFDSVVGSDRHLWEFAGEIHGLNGPEALVMVPRGANDIVVDLVDISGEFFSMFLVPNEHMWQSGFAGEVETSENGLTITEQVGQLQTAQDNGVLLVGDAVITDRTLDTPPFSFTAAGSSEIVLQKVTTDVDLSVLNTSDRKRGALFMASHSIVYTFRLDGQLRRIRVLLSAPGVKPLMGVKQVEKDGQWYFLDKRTSQLVLDEPDVPWSFWNQGQDEQKAAIEEQLDALNEQLEQAEEDEDTERQDEINEEIVRMTEELATIGDQREEETAVTALFGVTKNYGMPIEVVGDIDFNDFKTKTITMDLMTSGSVGFRDTKLTHTEKSLADEHILILQSFDIPDLSLTARFTST